MDTLDELPNKRRANLLLDAVKVAICEAFLIAKDISICIATLLAVAVLALCRHLLEQREFSQGSHGRDPLGYNLSNIQQVLAQYAHTKHVITDSFYKLLTFFVAEDTSTRIAALLVVAFLFLSLYLPKQREVCRREQQLRLRPLDWDTPLHHRELLRAARERRESNSSGATFRPYTPSDCDDSLLLVGSLTRKPGWPSPDKGALISISLNDALPGHQGCRGCIIKQLGAILDTEDKRERMMVEVMMPSQTHNASTSTTFKISPRRSYLMREIYLTVPLPPKKLGYHDELDRYQHTSPTVRALNTSHIDYDFLRSCLAQCQDEHQRCEITSWTACTTERRNGTPILLMDLVDQCLVWETKDAEYACLSYVWGLQPRSFECRRDNITRLLEMGSFNDSSLFSVPPAIRDAMHFTVKMSLRYLWVDRYCIVQDDHREKAARIASMGNIYSGAVLTIIAADGDARDRLPGVSVPDHPSTRWRLFGSPAATPFRKPNCLTLSQEERKVSKSTPLFGVKHYEAMVGSSWATRGWTFQEYLFSRRAVVFHRGIVMWRCQEHVWQEDFEDPTPLENTIAATGIRKSQGERLNNMDRWPNLGRYTALLSQYSTRQLTYPCDSISAFSAVLDFLSQYSFPGGFLFGLPEVLFDVALLWQPAISGGGDAPLQLQDRVALAKEAGLDTAELPTWSWARWSGGFDLAMWSSASDCLRLSSYNQYICEITPIVQWYKVCETGAKHLIRNDFAKFRRKRLDPEAKASGFCREIGTPSDPSYQDFRYPIPKAPTVPPLENSTQVETSIWRPFISGRVSRSFVTVGEVEKVVMNGSSRWTTLQHGVVTVGVILLSDPVLPQTEIEVIRLSEGYCPPRPMCRLEYTVGFSDTALTWWELCKGEYRFYNVMWTSCTDGVAYRKAIGRIEKSSWDSLNVDEIDIVLG